MKYSSFCHVFIFTILALHVQAQALDCEFYNVEYSLSECQSDETFFVDISFEVENPGDAGFIIKGNGNDYGSFEYGDSIYRVGPLEGDCNTLYEFLIFDHDDELCRTVIELDKPVYCCSECELEIYDVVLGECDSTGFRTLFFNVENSPSYSEGFQLLYEDIPFLQFDYEMNPYSIQVPGEIYSNYIEIRDLSNPNCNEEFIYESEVCDIEVDCPPWQEFSAPREFVCTGLNTYEAYANLIYTGQSDSLWLSFYINNDNEELQYIKLLAVEDFPYLLGEFEVSDTLYYYGIHEKENVFCSSGNEWNDAPDCSGFMACPFQDIDINLSDCTDAGTFNILFSFQTDSLESEGFVVSVNNTSVDSFQYGQIVYETGLVDPLCDAQNFLILTDITTGCTSQIEFDPTECCGTDPCFIGDILVTDFECNDDGTYNFVLDFEYDNTTNEFFDVWAGDIFVGYYSYRDLPVIIEDFIPRDVEYDLIKICDNDNPDCCTIHEFMGPDCDGEVDCPPWQEFDTQVEFLCTSLNTYEAYANLIYTGQSDSLSLSFYINNDNEELQYVKLLAVEDFPYLLGEFEVSDTLYYYAIHETDNMFCETGNEWNDAPDCSEYAECPFQNIDINLSDCTASGTFNISFSFQTDTLESSGFIAMVNNTVVDSFQYGQIVYETGLIDPMCDAQNYLLLIDISTGCIEEIPFDPTSCCEHEECFIDDIVITGFDCNENGTYDFILDFEYDNTTNEFFDVWAGDKFIGYYSYRDLPVIIEDFIPRNVEYDLIKICDNDNPDCCTIHEFMGPDCDDNQDDCKIYDLFVETYECTAVGSYYLDFEFEIDNAGDAGFIVKVNDTVFDSFNYGQVFYTLGPIPLDCSEDNILSILDAQYECAFSLNYGKPVCCDDEDCFIGDITVTDFDCHDEGSYSLLLDFEYENITNDFFDVWAGDIFIGYYSYQDLPVRIDSFYSRDVEYDVIKICDNDNPDCCTIKEFPKPDCDDQSDCPISELNILETYMTASGTIVVLAEFESESDRLFGLDIFVNGEYQYYEREAHSPLEIVLDSLDIQNEYVLKICLNDHPDCCLEAVFETETDRPCELFDLEVFQTICKDGFYYLVVDAEHGFGVSDQRFNLRGNGRDYGNFALSQIPVAIGPFHMDETINELVMRIYGIEGCLSETELEISCECTSNIIEIESEEFNITESGTEIIIESNGFTQFTVELYALDGRQVMSSSVSGLFTLNKTNYPAGIYIMNIRYNGTQKSFKVFMSN